MKSLVLGTSLFLVTSHAIGVDGVIEINQARALAGNVTTGDPPGFPVVINSSGSYVLTSNLTVTSANTTVLDVRVENVSVDLNGFSVTGPFACTSLPPSCSGGPFAGRGIEANNENMTVINGTVTGMGNDGIFVGNNSRVEGVQARCNCGDGIFASDGSTVNENISVNNLDNGIAIGNGGSVNDNMVANNGVDGVAGGSSASVNRNIVRDNDSNGIRTRESSTISENTVSGNGAIGIKAGFASEVSGNSVNVNFGDGIEAGQESLVVDNTANRNGGFGLDLPLGSAAASGYGRNVINGNTGGTVSGGIQIGTNVCNGNTTCP